MGAWGNGSPPSRSAVDPGSFGSNPNAPKFEMNFNAIIPTGGNA